MNVKCTYPVVTPSQLLTFLTFQYHSIIMVYTIIGGLSLRFPAGIKLVKHGTQYLVQ